MSEFSFFLEKLNAAGKDEKAWEDKAIKIMNEFTIRPVEVESFPFSAPDEFWLRKLAVLSERCAKAESAILEMNGDDDD